jgi:signal transduction histidine kinase
MAIGTPVTPDQGPGAGRDVPFWDVLILTVIQGPDKGKTFELPDDEPQLLGRSSEALPIVDNTVSRRHAELTPDDGVWWISDLGSQNGTWVNGVRIAQRTALNAGDQIRTGATLWVFGRTGQAGRAGGASEAGVRILHSDDADIAVERTLPSNEDSVMLSESVLLGGAESESRSAAVEHLRVLYRLSTLTSRPSNRAELLEGVMDLVFSVFRPERGAIMIREQGDDELTPVVVRHGVKGRGGRADRGVEAKIAVPRSVLGVAMRKGEGVLATNAQSDPRFGAGDSIARLDVRSVICSPVRSGDRTFGAIYIDSTSGGGAFTGEHLALMNAIGQQTGLALANQELYEQKLNAERLAAMGETVASLSHSIKNILQGLRGGADVVELGLKKNDLKVASGGWGILKRNLGRIISLTMNMLAYSRPRTLEIELTRLAGLLEDCASLMQDQCAARDVAMILDVDPDIPPIGLDPGQVHQAVMNLLTNAVEAVEAKSGVVTLRANYRLPNPAAPGTAGLAEARIDVIDNGPGIPPEKAAKIFEPFFTTKGLRGTGLGLAVSRRIIEQHGGRIEVQSQLARGSVFSIILPVAPGQVIDPSETAHSRGDPARRGPDLHPGGPA